MGLKESQKMHISLLLMMVKSILALAGTVVIFLFFPLLNSLFKGELLKEEESEITKHTILMEMVTQKPKPQKVKPRKMRKMSNSPRNTKSSSQTSSQKFSPDLSLGAGSGVGVGVDGGFENMIFNEGDTDERPIPIRQSPLEYPKAARRARIEGLLEVLFLVNREGHVQDIEFVKVPHRMFEKPIRKTIMTWRFKPAMLQGVPVAVRVRQKVDFNLQK